MRIRKSVLFYSIMTLCISSVHGLTAELTPLQQRVEDLLEQACFDLPRMRVTLLEDLGELSTLESTGVYQDYDDPSLVETIREMADVAHTKLTDRRDGKAALRFALVSDDVLEPRIGAMMISHLEAPITLAEGEYILAIPKRSKDRFRKFPRMRKAMLVHELGHLMHGEPGGHERFRDHATIYAVEARYLKFYGYEGNQAIHPAALMLSKARELLWVTERMHDQRQRASGSTEQLYPPSDNGRAWTGLFNDLHEEDHSIHPLREMQMAMEAFLEVTDLIATGAIASNHLPAMISRLENAWTSDEILAIASLPPNSGRRHFLELLVAGYRMHFEVLLGIEPAAIKRPHRATLRMQQIRTDLMAMLPAETQGRMLHLATVYQEYVLPIIQSSKRYRFHAYRELRKVDAADFIIRLLEKWIKQIEHSMVQFHGSKSMEAQKTNQKQVARGGIELPHSPEVTLQNLRQLLSDIKHRNRLAVFPTYPEHSIPETLGPGDQLFSFDRKRLLVNEGRRYGYTLLFVRWPQFLKLAEENPAGLAESLMALSTEWAMYLQESGLPQLVAAK